MKIGRLLTEVMDRKHKTRGGWPNWRDGQWMQNVSKYLEVIGNVHDTPDLETKEESE